MKEKICMYCTSNNIKWWLYPHAFTRWGSWRSFASTEQRRSGSSERSYLVGYQETCRWTSRSTTSRANYATIAWRVFRCVVRTTWSDKYQWNIQISWRMSRNPRILDELHEIPDSSRKTKVGEQFFIYDSFEDEHYRLDCYRILVLYCQIDKIRV